MVCRYVYLKSLKKLKLEPDKFFMSKPSQNYRVSPKVCINYELQTEAVQYIEKLLWKF